MYLAWRDGEIIGGDLPTIQSAKSYAKKMLNTGNRHERNEVAVSDEKGAFIAKGKFNHETRRMEWKNV